PQAPRDDDASAPIRWTGWSGWRTRGNPAKWTCVHDPRRPWPRPDSVVSLSVSDAVGALGEFEESTQRAHGVIGGPRRATNSTRSSPALAPECRATGRSAVTGT